MASTIIVLEGPAGCGKSTLAKTLVNVLPGAQLWKPLAHTERPRAYAGMQGHILAFTKDIITNLSILSMIEEEVPYIIVDRWAFSEWVYNTLRSCIDPLKQSKDTIQVQIDTVLRAANMSYMALTHEHSDRLHRDTSKTVWPTAWYNIFMQPSDSLLHSNRLTAIRNGFRGETGYPYNLYLENYLYQRIAERLPAECTFPTFYPQYNIKNFSYHSHEDLEAQTQGFLDDIVF